MNLFRRIASIKDVLAKLNVILTRRQKVLGGMVVVMTVINAVLQTIGVSIVVPLVSMMITPQEMMHQKYVIWICNTFRLHETKQFFIFLCIAVIILYLLKDVFCVFQLWVSARYSFKVQRELSTSVLENYMKRSYDFFLNYGTTQIIRDIKIDAYHVNTILAALVSLLTELLTMCFITVYIFVMDWRMALCVLIMAFICISVYYSVFKNKLKRAGEQERRMTAESQKVLLEAIEGIKEVQVMRKQSFFINAFIDFTRKEQEPQITQRIITESPTYVIEGIFIVGLLAFIAIRVMTDPQYVREMPVLASFMMGAVRMLPSLGRVSSRLSGLSYDLPSLDSVFHNVVGLETEGKELICQKDEGKNISFQTDLSVRNVTWTYLDSERQVLQHLNLKINKGQSIGIIGKSGAGKSTLADIILGLHIPQQGSVEIDGRRINEIPFEYSRVIGYVPQTVYLVDGTIRENVAFGVERDQVDDDWIWETLKQAKLDQFVRTREMGLDTVIGDRGVRFSGGQRQRLAIARALYRKPQILVLDEATSALDNETESAVMDAIEGLYGSVTMIMIAHRLTTVKQCDEVYEIVNGIAIKRDKKELFG